MKKTLGSIVWTDLTVDNADEVKDFYNKVVGWKHQGVKMGDYEDYIMKANEEDKGTAGICYARGSNANIPPQWMIYVSVADVKAAAQACVANGGSIVDGPRMLGQNEFAVIKDPAGAVMGIIQE